MSIGTWTKRLCLRPTTMSVRPAIPACAAAWANLTQYTESCPFAGTERIEYPGLRYFRVSSRPREA